MLPLNESLALTVTLTYFSCLKFQHADKKENFKPQEGDRSFFSRYLGVPFFSSSSVYLDILKIYNLV